MKIELDEGLILRNARIHDGPSIARHACDYEIKRCLTDSFPYPYRESDYYEYYREVSKPENPHRLFVIEKDGAAAGTISITLQEGIQKPSAETGYWLGRKYWGQGIASQVLRKLIEYGFENHDFLNKIFAYVFDFNIGSQKVLENCGMKRNAVLKEQVLIENKLRDMYFYEIFRKEYETDYKL